MGNIDYHFNIGVDFMIECDEFKAKVDLNKFEKIVKLETLSELDIMINNLFDACDSNFIKSTSKDYDLNYGILQGVYLTLKELYNYMEMIRNAN